MASTDQEAIKDRSANQSPATGLGAGPPEEELTPVVGQMEPKKRGRKRKREAKEGNGRKKQNAVETDSPVERPSRERRSVVRYAATAPRRFSVTKTVNILQGSGEKLKDIPNVSFKISKRKSDDSLRVFHMILFGRKTNAHYLKRNILQFSGFVWSHNKEKERSRVVDKLNKCNKDRLLEYCDLLDIYTLKATTKKEEISAQLTEFLESPHATREVIISAENTKRKQSRRGGVKEIGESPPEEASHTRKKKLFKNVEKFEAKKNRKKSANTERKDLDKAGSVAEESHEQSYSEPEDVDDAQEELEMTNVLLDREDKDVLEETKLKEKSPAVRKVSHAKSTIVRSPSSTKKADAQDNVVILPQSKTSRGKTSSSKQKKDKATVIKKSSKNNSTDKVSQKKSEPGSGSGLSKKSKKSDLKRKANVETTMEDRKENKKRARKTALKDMNEKKQTAKSKSNIAGKIKGKRGVVVGPSREMLLAVVSEILKEVDFNVVTLADIIKQLGAHFSTDLMHRKTEIKDILQEVINNMIDEEDTEDDDGDGDGDDDDDDGDGDGSAEE